MDMIDEPSTNVDYVLFKWLIMHIGKFSVNH